jgi:hypothetical protein
MSEGNSAWLPGEPPASPSADHLETLGYLRRAIELADGFALLFARCDRAVQRDELIARLDRALTSGGLAPARLDVVPPAVGLLAGLRAACGGPTPPVCVHVCGLETAMPPGSEHPPVLEQLNLARDRFRALPCPAVFWMPDEALTRLARSAPDFWAWRSGTFARRTEEQIHVLEGLLADYRDLPDGPIEQRARVTLLLDLADLYRMAYRPRAARRRLRTALSLGRQLGDAELEARALDVQRALDVAREP